VTVHSKWGNPRTIAPGKWTVASVFQTDPFRQEVQEEWEAERAIVEQAHRLYAARHIDQALMTNKEPNKRLRST
jgi:hypothetical protein